MQTNPSVLLVFLFCLVHLSSLSGCNSGDRPPLGSVSGVVTMDGKPTEGLAVIFTQPGYRSSGGVTNAEGRYELKYLKDVKGAVLGEHQVRIQHAMREGTNKKPIAEKYNRQSELRAVVKKGSNTFNFELASK